MATFDELIQQIDNSNINNERDRGTAFEHMVISYLKNEPVYKHKYKNVWMLSEVPEEYDIPKIDTGVDIVACDYNDNLTAVQAKFYKGKVGKDTINSFVAETGKEYYSSGIIVSTTDDWNINALNTLRGNSKTFTIIGLSQLRHASFKWEKFSFVNYNDLSKKNNKKLRNYQKKAIIEAVKYFNYSEYEHNDRGKLIMAPGTGKTFTSLKITEALMNDQSKDEFNVLYLVPSIQLLSQTLFNWNDDVDESIVMNSMSVVSDRKATKRGMDNDLNATDIGFPATTNLDELMNNYYQLKRHNYKNVKVINVIFSTYQSIDVIHNAQTKGYPDFDLIIADEAHRTTGATKLNEDSNFTKVNSNKNVRGKIRLYQTATPKIYDENAKKKAIENSVEISSMDDEKKYGKEFFRLGFGEAVLGGWLTDYKVSVIAVNESYINKDMQNIMSDNNGLKVDDIGKIIGVWNAMVKRDGLTGEITGAPMKRVIGFTDTIKHSKTLSNEFNQVVNEYLGSKSDESFKVNVHHVDGGLNALRKNDEIEWLSSNNLPNNNARMLSNVRFLTEGIDVPNLDGIVFFNPKKSQVDIVQAVGRIMRLAPGKEYGYIIIPVVIPDGMNPSDALDNNNTYRAVWQVLNALRSTDERFEAEINKLDLNKKKSGRISQDIIGNSPKKAVTEDDGLSVEKGNTYHQIELPLDWKQMQDAFYGKIVQKVGDRRYLEDWSKDVSIIAKQHIRRINDLINYNAGARMAFEKFLNSLHYNINDSIKDKQAVEMLAQHLITEPIFDSLFGKYSFVKNNNVSKSMNDVILTFKSFGFNKEQENLKPLYDSIKTRSSGIDNAEGKQKLIITLYDSFFRTGFKSTTEQLGIVFTPIEVVDFIINSVDYALKKHLNKTLIDNNVHILDPFTGTGTFITRTLNYFNKQMENNQITYNDILHKYLHELHANEIILLSYYIAAINIESVFDELGGDDHSYIPFEGIVLTDTFESTEKHGSIMDDMLGDNNKRLRKQQEKPITVIVSNPPYSAGQHSISDDNANESYPYLENRVKETYVDNSEVSNTRSLYDSYIEAIRWSSDRIDNNGVIGFVTNGSFISNNNADGLRKSLFEEFNYLYIFNLRGNARTQGEQRKKESGNVFGSGTRTPIAISILVKDESSNHKVYYSDIGDYLDMDKKLSIVNSLSSISNINWDEIIPDKHNDWINKRDDNYQTYIPMSGNNGIFIEESLGVSTSRDPWAYGFNKDKIESNIEKMVSNYNNEVIGVKSTNDKLSKINLNPKKIGWTYELKKRFSSGKTISYNKENMKLALYRPFTKKWLCYDKDIVESPRKFGTLFGKDNLVIIVPNKDSNNIFHPFITDKLPDYHLMPGGTKAFMLYNNNNELLFQNSYNISENSNEYFGLDGEELFYYIYGVLNSPEYAQKYANDLSKNIPRVPLLKHKEIYISVGRKLADIHINYEKVKPYEKVDIVLKDNPSYKVKKINFNKIRNEHGKKVTDKTSIHFNNDIDINNIPDEVESYVINGRTTIEWIMDQYRIKLDEKSNILDDPNEYSHDPKYIFNLLLSVINVSVQTVNLINKLPKFEVINSNN